MEDTCKVIIDKIFMKNKNAETGMWKKIYKGTKVEDVNIPPGFELILEGVKLNSKEEIKFDDE